MTLQNTDQVALGGTTGTFKKVENFPGNIAAGLAVVSKSDGTYTNTLSDGVLMGISLGQDESNTGKRFAVCREGSGVPIQAGSLTPVIGAQVQIHATSGKAVDSGTAVNAVIVSGLLDCVNEDGTITVDGCILIDMVGGL